MDTDEDILTMADLNTYLPVVDQLVNMCRANVRSLNVF